MSLSRLVFRAGCGIRLYRFLTIAFFFYLFEQYTIIDYWGIGHDVMSTREYHSPRSILVFFGRQSTIISLYNVLKRKNMKRCEEYEEVKKTM